MRMGFASKKRIAPIILVFILIFPLGVMLGADFENVRSSNRFSRIEVSAEDPEVDLSKLPEINFDNLSDQYYHPKIEMLIITPPGEPSFIDAVEPLKEWKDQKGVKTLILSNYTAYPGTDGPEKIRNMIKEYYEKENIQWVLLAGDAQDDLLPIRKVYNPDVEKWKQRSEDAGEANYKPTDFYYADLTGSWDKDDDGIWGEGGIGPNDDPNDVNEEINWYPEVYVGRLPANDADQLEIMINKTIKYETNPLVGEWMNRMLLTGGVSLYENQCDDCTDEDEARLTQYIWQRFVQGEMNFTHLYDTTSSFDPAPPPPGSIENNLNDEIFNNEFNSGYSTIIFAGHGAPGLFISEKTGTDLEVYTASEASASSNTQMPSLVYGDACTTSPYDISSDNNIGENLIKREDAGAIGYIGALRVTWYLQEDTKLEKLNRGNAKLFWKEFFQNKKYQPGKALYDSKVAYITSDYYTEGAGSITLDFERKNVLTYCLLGDPEIDIYTDTPKDVLNPFTKDIYEGQLASITVLNNLSQPVPNARVHFKTADGKYFTVYADETGEAKFRLLPQANEFYNVTITGHNLVPSSFNFTTKPDELNPEFGETDWGPQEPTVSHNLCFTADAFDQYSGVEGMFVLISQNDFEDYRYYTLSNKPFEDKSRFECIIDKLDPGEYSFLLVTRDYASNMEILYKTSFKFTIPVPLTNYVLIFAALSSMGIVGLAGVMIHRNAKNHKTLMERLEEFEL